MIKNTLSPTQQRAIAALLTARHSADAAKVAHVAERTLARWLADDVFRAALQAAQSRVLETAVRRMTTATHDALDVLCKVMNHGESEALQLRSALGLLAVLPAMRQLADFEGRLAALEAVAGNVA